MAFNLGLKKRTGMIILLVMYSVLFLLELGIGSAVHSLALVADAFHMFNDLVTTAVALWATIIAQRKSPREYTYGWQRAETLGAFFNGVFLVALCLSIIIEAIQRFAEKPNVSNPVLILIVGSVGLACNILGLLLFGGHDHSHGDGQHGHAHSHDETSSTIEQGKGAAFTGSSDGYTADSVNEHEGNGEPLPKNTTAVPSQPIPRHKSDTHVPTSVLESFGSPRSEDTIKPRPMGSPSATRKYSSMREHKRRISASSRSQPSPDDIPVHPTDFRENYINSAGRHNNLVIDQASDNEDGAIAEENEEVDEDTPLLKNDSNGSRTSKGKERRKSSQARGQNFKKHQPEVADDSDHATHFHRQPKVQGPKGGHSHGDLNMRGVFLHLFGDALGNFGVMLTALFIWQTSYDWRFYADPVISLIITVIILRSAIPLCFAAGKILMQVVPDGIDIAQIESDIKKHDGVVGCHHLHVWQLTDTTIVLSVHVELDFDVQGKGAKRYMDLARQMSECFHEYEIHSSTIQPEFRPSGSPKKPSTSGGLDGSNDPAQMIIGTNGSLAKPNNVSQSSADDKDSGSNLCWLDCKENCGEDARCCTTSGSSGSGSGSGSLHGQDHSH